MQLTRQHHASNVALTVLNSLTAVESVCRGNELNYSDQVTYEASVCCCLLLFGALRLQKEHEAEMVESGAHCVLILLFLTTLTF